MIDNFGFIPLVDSLCLGIVLFMYLAAIVGPIAGTAAFHAEPRLLWGACGVVGLISAALALAAGRRPVPDVLLEGPPR
jgi:hypothetical protein